MLRLEDAASVLLAAVTVLMCAVFFALPADDAYIVARYVRQLYEGHGLVFNPGEQINAITSPFLTLVIAVVYPLSREPIDLYRVVATVLTAWTLVVIARKAYPAKTDALLFLALTLASPFVCFWSVGGLETPLLLCACSWLTWVALSANADNGSRRAVQVIGLATIAVLTRYDSVLYVAPVAALFLVRYRSDARIVGSTIVCACVVAGWIAFTYAYYGDVLPTSFYVKFSGDETIGEIMRGAWYALSFGVLALVLPVLALRFGKRQTRRRRSASRLQYAVAGCRSGNRVRGVGRRQTHDVRVPAICALLAVAYLACFEYRRRPRAVSGQTESRNDLGKPMLGLPGIDGSLPLLS